MWLMDAYPKGRSVVLWLKGKRDERVEVPFVATLYAAPGARPVLERANVAFSAVRRQTCFGWKEVLAIPVERLDRFSAFVRWLERETGWRVPLYDADIAPEMQYLFANNLLPCAAVRIHHGSVLPAEGGYPPLRVMELSREGAQLFVDNEPAALEELPALLRERDPDALVMPRAFRELPKLSGCDFHRWDAMPLRYRGGRAFFTYGRVDFRDYAFRLHGRFLLDSASTLGHLEPDALMELCRLSGARLQQLASRSAGAVFQFALLREMYQRGYLIPHKEKPLSPPLSMATLLKGDRAGLTLDPMLGFHRDVAELDFASMFPWLMVNRNVSAEMLLSAEEPLEHVPGLPLTISRHHEGLVPIAVRPFLERRMEYKRNPTAVNKRRAAGLKAVLVSSNGYLRFREFKLGLPASHMAVCAYARETLLQAKQLAEERGFEVVHGIVDALYVKKRGMTELEGLRDDIAALAGIPVSLEGVFRWVVFLPSVNDSRRPVPARYFGVFSDGRIKARGIEVRQRSSPRAVRAFQQRCLETLAPCETARDIKARIPQLGGLLRETIATIPGMGAEELACTITLSKTEYSRDIPQKAIVEQLRGTEWHAGEPASFVFTEDGVQLAERFSARPDIERYTRLLARSLHVLLQPFGLSRKDVLALAAQERQALLQDYAPRVRERTLPVHDSPKRTGLSERLARRRLEKRGYEVWRGGILDITRRLGSEYPAVRRKYARLCALLNAHHPGKLEELQYLCAVHHGMPDFLCLKSGRFVFVECKLQHEQLSPRQKKCFPKLLALGFEVEVHRIADARVRTRAAEFLPDGRKRVLERQRIIARRRKP